jgi:hypothetical protein
MNCRRINELTPIAILTIVFLTCLLPGAMAQDSSQQPSAKPASEALKPNTYRLDFTLSEIENGKKSNARSYLMLAQASSGGDFMSTGTRNSLRIGKKVPIATGSLEDAKAVQFQYLDVGMSIECRVREVQRGVLLDLSVDFSNIAAEQSSNPVLATEPAIGRVTTQVNTFVELEKPTVVSRMDDPSTKRTFELQVTATKLTP